MIVLAVIAVVGGADSWLDIAAFWQACTSLHRRLFANDYGIPAHDTFRRVFILLPFASIQRCLKGWLTAMQAAGLLRLEDDITTRRGEAVGFVRRWRRVGQTEREQVSFFVTSLKQDVKRFARAVRA